MGNAIAGGLLALANFLVGLVTAALEFGIKVLAFFAQATIEAARTAAQAVEKALSAVADLARLLLQGLLDSVITPVLAPILAFLQDQAEAFASDLIGLLEEFNETGEISGASAPGVLEPLALMALAFSLAIFVLLTLITGLSFVGVGVLINVVITFALPFIVEAIVGQFADHPVGAILAALLFGSYKPAMFAATDQINATLSPEDSSGGNPDGAAELVANSIAFGISATDLAISVIGIRIKGLGDQIVGLALSSFGLFLAGLGLFFITNPFESLILSFVALGFATAGAWFTIRDRPTLRTTFDKVAFLMSIISLVAAISFVVFWSLVVLGQI